MSALKLGLFSSALVLLTEGGLQTGHFEVTGHLVWSVQTWVREDGKQAGPGQGDRAAVEPGLPGCQPGGEHGESAIPVTASVACSEGCF